ncbi:MAG: hypothetical protein R3B09_21335 [Nannocystaceae bacterium]
MVGSTRRAQGIVVAAAIRAAAIGAAMVGCGGDPGDERPETASAGLTAASSSGAATTDEGTTAATDTSASTTGSSTTAVSTADVSTASDPSTGDPSTSEPSTSEPSTTVGPADLGGEPEGSRCTESPTMVVCPKVTIELGPWMRDVHYQVPLGDPPPAGWPAVLMFQGSFFSAEVTWLATDDLPFGAMNQTLTVKALLDHGYAVITPETKLNGGTFWDTNVPPYSINWESSEDHLLMLEIFSSIDEGAFGPIDAASLHATGVSSGGYMTSRVGLAYPGRFRSLAIAAGSYMTCSGPLCSIPDDLPPTHPPTLFLHGGVDPTVPLSTAEAYHEALKAIGVDTRMVVDPLDGHGWIAASPGEVLMWFEGHP